MRRASLALAMTIIALSAAPPVLAQDRYGPTPDRGSDQPEPLPMLTWPGKPPAPTVQTSEDRYASTARLRPASLYDQPPQRPAPSNINDPPPPRWQAAEPVPSEPQSPPAPQPMPQGTGEGLPPHFYSVARQYGVQPDPVQLSPQFLAATPQTDIAEPLPAPPPHTAGPRSANMSPAAATNLVRQAQQSAADADAAALGN